MDGIKTVTELKAAIQMLEIKAERQKQNLELGIRDKVEALKPANLVKKWMGYVLSSPLQHGLVKLAFGIGTGIVFRKYLLKNATLKLGKLFLNLAQIGVGGFLSARASKSRLLKNHEPY
jgi:hypothetical protein